ncbi:MAG: 1-acyl-sn-glycerol-3-phosphate acyltransferase [Gemmataceae bacterium]|nr:1-acyl-sn-glycerol-3-phosphate acyltransferase [Gemmataceae bacterium]
MTAIRDRLPAFFALVVGVVGCAVVAGSADRDPPADGAWFAFALGGLVPLLFWHPFRALGFVPPAAAAVFGLAAYGAATGEWPRALLAVPAGVIWVAALGRAVVHARPGDSTPLGCAVLGFVLPAAVILTLIGLGDWAAWGLAGMAGAAALFAWWALFRPFFELFCEPVISLMYRVRGTGPGLADIPPRGPCLVIGNHACWADPFFIAKVLPRPITPVMTSQFYDKPVIRWLMRRVIKAIRVPEKALKQDVPQEIKEVIAALDRGECVVLFPEGYLRRSDDRPLRRFGRGVWQVLSARPDTPVFPCWIEGGWGSYTSYKGGLPTKNKRPDFRRRIGVAVDARVTLAPETLAHHLATRIELMNRVAAGRKLLGLPELPPYTLAGREEEKDGAADDADRSAD